MSLRTKLLADLLSSVFGFVRETATSKVVRAEQSVTGGITKIWTGTQAEYDAIATPADDTLYVIVEA